MEQITNRNTRAKVPSSSPQMFRGPSSTLSSGRHLRNEYNDWLSRINYDWFITLTFRDQEITEHAARRAFNSFVKTLNSRLYRYGEHKGRRLRFVAAMERNSSDGLHFHMLLIREKGCAGKLEHSKLLPLYITYTWEERIRTAGSNNHARKATESDVSYITKELPKNDDCLIIDWL